jgi:hypothetical protein
MLICGLFCGYVIYAKGIKDGKAFAQGKPVAILPQPIKAIKKAKEEKEIKKENEKMFEYQERLFNYDGFKESER